MLATFLLLAVTASSASADSDISTGMAYVGAPGQGVSLPGMRVTNEGPDPAAGVTLAGTVPNTDNEGHSVNWQIFTNAATNDTSLMPFLIASELTGPPFGADPCTFTSATDYRCDIGPLAVGETRTVVFNPTWEVSNSSAGYTQWTGFSYTAALVGGVDPDSSNNDDDFNFINNAFYYNDGAAQASEVDFQVVEQTPPASGAYAPGETVTLALTSTVPAMYVGGSVSVVVPDLDSVTCSGDGVCLTGGPQAMTGPPNRVLVAMAGAPAPGSFWPDPPLTGPYVFTTLLSAKLPAAAPAGCAPGRTAPYTFDTTQQPVSGGSALVSSGIIKLPLTVQVQCPDQASTPPVEPPPAGYDVSITKKASSGRVKVGGKLSYTIVARNAGPGEASGVVVTDSVPGQLKLRNVKAQQGECSSKGSTVSCALGTLAAGETVRIQVRTVAVRSGTVTNTARVSAAGEDPRQNNVASAKSRVIRPKLRVTKRVSDRQIRAGQSVTYRIRVSNPSRQALRHVRVCDQLPAGMVYRASTPEAKLRKGRFCWSVARLRAGQSKTFRVKVRALAGTQGVMVNHVRATSPDARPDRAKQSVRVVGAQVKAGGVTG